MKKFAHYKDITKDPADKPAKRNRAAEFTQLLADVYRGPRKPDCELYEPLLPVDQPHRYVGPLTDPIAKELFSLHMQLAQEMSLVPQPRKPAELQEYGEETAVLEHQIELVLGLFDNELRAAYPDIEKDAKLVVAPGWKVMAIMHEVIIAPYFVPCTFHLTSDDIPTGRVE